VGKTAKAGAWRPLASFSPRAGHGKRRLRGLRGALELWRGYLGTRQSFFGPCLTLRGIRSWSARKRARQENVEAAIQPLVGHPIIGKA
jgi:hypothetical protein